MVSVASAAHCINPDCPRPFAQPWGNKFCNSCRAPLQLKNRYIPLHPLGSGGFAKIYTVWDLQAQTERVLKVLVETSPKAQELFEQEAAVLQSLRHPGVPRVKPDSYFQLTLSHPRERTLSCLVMEKIAGCTLEDILKSHPQGCSEAQVLNWLNQALEILDELHRRHIIHRDIKPSNLMLRQDTGQLVAIDFGGAKQIGSNRQSSQASSTRLFTQGYSPPEQIAGSAVGPAADFYALGRTMIQLLTAKSPEQLEDPDTGELRWRNQARVSQNLADAIDEMVQADVRKRPATVAQIQTLLAGSSAKTQALTSVGGKNLAPVWDAIAAAGSGATKVTLVVVGAIAKITLACLDTIWEMLLGGIGALVGATLGFVLAYWTPLGAFVASVLDKHLSAIAPGVSITVEPPILLFALAGLGTAVGLTKAGGFNQRRRFWVAGPISVLGYSLAWSIWQATATSGVVQRLVGLIVVAVTCLALGLGLPSHHLVHAVFAAGGTGALVAVFVSLNILPADVTLSNGFTSFFGNLGSFHPKPTNTLAHHFGVGSFLLLAIGNETLPLRLSKVYTNLLFSPFSC